MQKMNIEELIAEIDSIFGWECDKKCSECIGCQLKNIFNETKKDLETLDKIKHIMKFPISRCSTCNLDIDCSACELRQIENEINKL